jgi:hypothetical protein
VKTTKNLMFVLAMALGLLTSGPVWAGEPEVSGRLDRLVTQKEEILSRLNRGDRVERIARLRKLLDSASLAVPGGDLKSVLTSPAPAPAKEKSGKVPASPAPASAKENARTVSGSPTLAPAKEKPAPVPASSLYAPPDGSFEMSANPPASTAKVK